MLGELPIACQPRTTEQGAERHTDQGELLPRLNTETRCWQGCRNGIVGWIWCRLHLNLYGFQRGFRCVEHLIHHLFSAQIPIRRGCGEARGHCKPFVEAKLSRVGAAGETLTLLGSAFLQLEPKQQGGEICWANARNVGGLAQRGGLNGRELFARLPRQGADAGVIEIGGEFAQALAFHLIDLLLLALQVAAVFNVDFRALPARLGEVRDRPGHGARDRSYGRLIDAIGPRV